MNGSKKSKKIIQALLWIFKHLFFPAIVALLAIMINNYYQARKQPALTTLVMNHQIMEISEEHFKVKCPFTISNKGGSSTQNKNITFLIPHSLIIDNIDIPNEYKSFYNIEEGGSGYNYAVFSIDLPKGKSIKGTLIFDSNVKIPEDSMTPLKIIY